MARGNSVLDRLAAAAQSKRPQWSVTLPPRWAKLLVAAGARPAAAPDAMTRFHRTARTASEHPPTPALLATSPPHPTGPVVDHDIEPGGERVDVETFAGLEPDVRQRVAAAATPCAYGKGQLLFEQGDPGDSLIMLKQGAVAIYRISTSGERKLLSVMRPPDVLGEASLLDGSARSASAEAIEDSSALVLSRAVFLKVVLSDPTILEAVMRSLGALVRRLAKEGADRAPLDLPGRVARALVRLVGDSQAPTIPFELDQVQLAEMAGASRQDVNHAIGYLADQSWLRIEGRRLVVTDLPALRRRAGLEPLGSSPLRVAALETVGRERTPEGVGAPSASQPQPGRNVDSPAHSGTDTNQRADILVTDTVLQQDKVRQIVGAERQTLAKDFVKRYTEGESIRSIATSAGRSYGFVHRVLTEAGVQVRQRGGARRRKKA